MPVYRVIRNSTRNQSTADFYRDSLFIYGNRYQEGVLVNNLGETMQARNGFLVVRNAGTYETATFKFADLADTETVIIAGLTYTASGATLAATVAAAFAGLLAGHTGTGQLAGTLGAYNTSAVLESDSIVFTSTAVGNVTDLAATGTGSVTSTTVIDGTAGTVNGFSPATSANLANIIGVLKITDVDLADAATSEANYCVKGDLDSGLIVLPIGVTLDTIVGGSKSLKDILTDLGFVLFAVTENSKFDN